jgi:hypothetical protein
MILPDFIIPSRVNQSWNYTGIDSAERCLDKEMFENYPHKIIYSYNSRGFRDAEWPVKLRPPIWCIGDSFTAGVGNPVRHTWPAALSKIMKTRTINISMDGASNEWIARRAKTLITDVRPGIIVLHWSYTNRREDPDTTLSDEERRIYMVDATATEDLKNTLECIRQVESLATTTKLVHTFIPDFAPVDSRPLFKMVINKLVDRYVPEVVRLDYGRDGHHYGKLTAQQLAEDISKLI